LKLLPFSWASPHIATVGLFFRELAVGPLPLACRVNARTNEEEREPKKHGAKNKILARKKIWGG
jgi:hypothetical protein